MEKSQLENRIFGLDLMRTIAILMVLFGHCLIIYPPSQSLVYQFGLVFGFLGVEVFFVLSGFLIGRILYYIYLEKEFSPKTMWWFLKRRWFRTLPNYYLILIINIIISLIIGYTITDCWKYFFFLQNFNTPMLAFFPESWSLSVEEFAYLLLPIALFVKTLMVRSKNKSRFFFLVVFGLMLFFILSKVYYAFTTTNTTLDQWNMGLKAVVMYRLDAIFLGVLFSWISLNFNVFWKKYKISLAVLGLILFGLLFVGVGFFQITIELFPNFWNIFYLPLTSLMCALFLPFLSEWKSLRFTFIQRPIVFISVISYSIYLLHYSVVLQLLIFYFPVDELSQLHLHLYTFSYVAITAFLSALLYKFYEKPMMDLRDK